MNNREYYKFLETKRKKANANGFKIKNENSYNKKLTGLLKEIKEINLIFGAISSKVKKYR